ncbi:T9SS type A sorting domain-containing protein, partial [bacterium]|nr:T9SS type A sorting domain-containing protein [bacterium]
IFIVLGLACLDHLYADGLLVTYELKVKIINYGTSYVQIKWTPRFDLSTGDVHYDSSLTPIPAGHTQYLEQTFNKDILLVGASTQGYSTTSPSNNGCDRIFDYGKYLITITINLTFSRTITIDTRDCRYGRDIYGNISSSSPYYPNKDFFVTYDASTNNLYCSQYENLLSTPISEGATRAIWNIAEIGAPVTSFFKNFSITPTSTAAMSPVTVSINGVNQTLAKDQTYRAALGFQGTNVPVVTRLKAGSNIYFSKWSDGVLFDTVRTFYVASNAVDAKAIYKQSNHVAAVQGPQIFTQKQTLNYYSNMTGSYKASFQWFIKWNFSGVWQPLSTGASASVVPMDSYEYCFQLRYFMRDTINEVAMYTAEDYSVDYVGQCEGCGGNPIASKESDLSQSVASDNSSSYGLQLDFSTMSDVEKKEWLRPIKETVRASGYHFRWTENDPYTEGLDPYVEALDQEESMGAKSIPETIPSTTPEIKPALLSKTSSASSLSSMPEQFRITANYPNPFNPSTTIAFEVPQETQIKLTVYNTLGQKVKTLYRGVKSTGRHTVQWDATNDSGNMQPSGIYIVRLEAGTLTQSHKITLMK